MKHKLHNNKSGSPAGKQHPIKTTVAFKKVAKRGGAARTRKDIKKETYVIQRTKRTKPKLIKRNIFNGNNTNMRLSYRSTLNQMGGAVAGISLTDDAKIRLAKFKLLLKEYASKFTKFFKSSAQKTLTVFLTSYEKFSICSDEMIVKSVNLKKAWDKLNHAILKPLLGIHDSGSKHTEPLITLDKPNMQGNRIRIVLSRLANLRKNNTVHFAYRCTSVRGTLKKAGNAGTHVGRTISTGYKKLTGKYVHNNNAVLKQTASIDYTYFMCALRDYRLAELKYNRAQSNLVRKFVVEKQFAAIGSKTRFNGLDIFKLDIVNPQQQPGGVKKQAVALNPMARQAALQAKTDTNIKDLDTLLTKIKDEEKTQGRAGSGIKDKYVKSIGESDDKYLPILTYIYNNSVYLAAFINLARQRLYLETLIRPNDELSFSESSISSDDTRDKSNRLAFIQSLYWINNSVDDITKQLTPSIDKFVNQQYHGAETNEARQEAAIKDLLLNSLQTLYSKFMSPNTQQQDARDFIIMIRLFIKEHAEQAAKTAASSGTEDDGEMGFIAFMFNTIDEAVEERFPEPDSINRMTKSDLANILLELIKYVKAGNIGGGENNTPQHEETELGGGAVYGDKLATVKIQQGALHSSRLIPNVDYNVGEVENTQLKYVNITESGLVKLYSIILKLLQNPYFISKLTGFDKVKSTLKSVFKDTGRVEDGSSPMEVYLNYLLKMDYGVLGYDINSQQLDKLPLDYPHGTAMSNMPGFITAFLYKHYYHVSEDINFSDFSLLDLKIHDLMAPANTNNKKYVYSMPTEDEPKTTIAENNENGSMMEELIGLFNDAAVQGEYVTIPPSFLPFTLYTNAELLSLLQEENSDQGVQEIRGRIEDNSLSLGKMDNMQAFMDNAGEVIIKRLYTKLNEYGNPISSPNAEISQDELRVIFDITLSRIMVFLKLNHLFTDLVQFKKLPSKIDNKNSEHTNEAIKAVLYDLIGDINETIGQLKADAEARAKEAKAKQSGAAEHRRRNTPHHPAPHHGHPARPEASRPESRTPLHNIPEESVKNNPAAPLAASINNPVATTHDLSSLPTSTAGDNPASSKLNLLYTPIHENPPGEVHTAHALSSENTSTLTSHTLASGNLLIPEQLISSSLNPVNPAENSSGSTAVTSASSVSAEVTASPEPARPAVFNSTSMSFANHIPNKRTDSSTALSSVTPTRGQVGYKPMGGTSIPK